MAADGKPWCPVDIEHTHLHGLRAAGDAVSGAEAQVERRAAAVGIVDRVLGRRPFQVSGVGVEQQALRGACVVVERQAHGVVVRIERAHGEAERVAFAHDLQRQGRDARRLVDVRHPDQ